MQLDVSIEQHVKACQKYAQKNGREILRAYDDHKKLEATMKKLLVLVLLFCLLLPCVADSRSLSSFAWDYNLYAGMFGLSEISASDAQAVDGSEMYRFSCPGDVGIFVRTDMRGGYCIAPVENSDAFLRSCAALFFTIHGTDGIIDFLGTLLFNVLYVDYTDAEPVSVGNAVYKLSCSGGLLVFSFALVK